jgi:pyruvate,water dikinase
MNLTISFPGAEQTSFTEVGGKGYSLIRMVEAGVPVPPGAVLTAAFFDPWFDEIKASAIWPVLAEATPEKWPTLCSELKGLCLALPLTGTQRQALEVLSKNLVALGDNVQFAVRSSSPEEDLVTASFAGGYETRLGVRRWSAICVAGASHYQVPAPGSRDGNRARGTPKTVRGCRTIQGNDAQRTHLTYGSQLDGGF